MLAAGMTPDLYLAINFRAEKKRVLQDGLRTITTTLKVSGADRRNCSHARSTLLQAYSPTSLSGRLNLTWCDSSSSAAASFALQCPSLTMPARRHLTGVCKHNDLAVWPTQALMDLKDPNPLKNMR